MTTASTPHDLVAVVVASSRVGRAAIEALSHAILSGSQHKQTKLRAVLRDSRRADPSWQFSLVEVFSGFDVDDNVSVTQAFLGVTKALIVAPQLQNRDEIVNRLLTSAKAQGVRHVVLIGGVFQEEERFLFHRQWMSSRRRAQELDLPWTQLECSDFMENLLGSCSSIKSRGQLCGVFPDGVSSPVALSDIGKAAASVLLDQSENHKCRAYKVVGPEALTPVQIAQIVAEVTRSVVEFVDIGLEESKKRALESGRAPWQVEGFADWLNLYFASGCLKDVKSDLPQLGVQPLTLRQWVSDNLSKFVHQHASSTPEMALS